MATGSFQVIMKSIATTGIWPWLQLAAVVIGGKNGAEILHTRIRPFGVGWTKQKHALNQQQQQWSIAYSCDDFFDSL